MIAAALVYAPFVSAQSVVPAPTTLPDYVSLEGALKIFREHGLDLLIAEAAVYSAEGDLKIAGAVPNPGWSLGAAYTFTFGAPPLALQNTPWGLQASLSDSSALEDSLSGKRGLRLKVARAALQAARMSRADAQRTLEFTVKQTYIQAVLARDNLDFALEVQKSATQTYELQKLRYEKGAISEADEAKVETTKLEADQAVDSAGQALRLAKVSLAFLLGVRAQVPDYRVEQDLPKFIVPPKLAALRADVLLDDAIQHRPDLRSQAFQRDRAAASIRLAKRLRFPDLSLDLGYSQNEGTNANAAQPPTFTFGLGGTLPLFYFQAGEIKKAEADWRTQDLELAKTQAQVVSDVETAVANFDSSRRLVARMEERLLERARRARDLVAVQYQKGAASLLEFLDAQRQYIATNVEYLSDLASYWTAVFQLEAAVGMDLR
jgi:cobalt-zinc-cadmium efflux system outer membrane protein